MTQRLPVNQKVSITANYDEASNVEIEHTRTIQTTTNEIHHEGKMFQFRRSKLASTWNGGRQS